MQLACGAIASCTSTTCPLNQAESKHFETNFPNLVVVITRYEALCAMWCPIY